MDYSLIIIGGGPAGYLAAQRAGQAGLKTLLIEKRSLGGVCLNEGCIPSKTLLYSAKLYEGAVNGSKYGVKVENAVLDHETVLNRKNKVVRTLMAGIRAQLKKSNVTVVIGTAKITGRVNGIDGSEGFTVEVEDAIYSASRLLIATGSVPVIPPIPGAAEGVEKGTVLTNREILDLKAIPPHLVIVGGGVVGLEMASYFNTAGSKVTVIEMLDRIAGAMDREISGILMKNYMKKGIEFKLGARVTEIRGITAGIDTDSTDALGLENQTTEVIYETEGQSFCVQADAVLMSVGRKPATDDLGLEATGVHMEHGRIVTDAHMQTNVPGLYAAGDINGVSMLAHTAYMEAEVCISHILGKEDFMRYHAIPSVIYTNPEVAGVGETEESAKDKGIDILTTKLPMMYSGRYAAENEGGDGICKVLVDSTSKKLIGVHMIGNYSSEIIYGAGLMIEKGMCVEDIKDVVFPHPTVSEIIREVLLDIEN